MTLSARVLLLFMAGLLVFGPSVLEAMNIPSTGVPEENEAAFSGGADTFETAMVIVLLSSFVIGGLMLVDGDPGNDYWGRVIFAPAYVFIVIMSQGAIV